jgi:uncharacterized repeat protein (TIGR02543 family)
MKRLRRVRYGEREEVGMNAFHTAEIEEKLMIEKRSGLNKIVCHLLCIALVATSVFIIAPTSDNANVYAYDAKEANNKIIVPQKMVTGKKYEIVFVGDNQDGTAHADGDTKYAPSLGFIDADFLEVDEMVEIDFEFDSPPPYKCTFSPIKAGKYTIEMYYGLYTYDADEGEWNLEDWDDDKKEITVTVSYQNNKYKVKFNANKGKVSKKSKKVTNGKAYGKLPTPKRANYKFLGWYTKKSGGKKITKKSIATQVKAHTLYAHWKSRKKK